MFQKIGEFTHQFFKGKCAVDWPWFQKQLKIVSQFIEVCVSETTSVPTSDPTSDQTSVFGIGEKTHKNWFIHDHRAFKYNTFKSGYGKKRIITDLWQIIEKINSNAFSCFSAFQAQKSIKTDLSQIIEKINSNTFSCFSWSKRIKTDLSQVIEKISSNSFSCFSW